MMQLPWVAFFHKVLKEQLRFTNTITMYAESVKANISQTRTICRCHCKDGKWVILPLPDSSSVPKYKTSCQNVLYFKTEEANTIHSFFLVPPHTIPLLQLLKCTSFLSLLTPYVSLHASAQACSSSQPTTITVLIRTHPITTIAPTRSAAPPCI